MTDDRLPNPLGKSSIPRKFCSWLLIIPSVVIGIILVDFFCRLFIPSIASIQKPQSWSNRAVFLDGRDTIFRNQGDIFTYTPHNEVRNLTVFFTDHDFRVEYDYSFRTNNLGLVQDQEVMPERDSILLLGDSFTEGQGAEPWFRLVSPQIAKLGYQAVNGGLLGTGFEQWLKLDRFLAGNNVFTRKVVVLFISDDYRRPVRNLEPRELRCLAALALCRFEESYFYRLPPRDELPAWIAKIKLARSPMTERSWLGERAEMLLPASYRVYKYFSTRIKHPGVIERSQRAEQQSRTAISELISLYGRENVAFIHLPQKDETDGPNELGLKARRSIEEAGGNLVDGFKLCRLTMADYYSNDEHPNSDGYAKIADCVMNVIKELAGRP